MFIVPEQYSAAAKAQFEAQISIFNALTSKALEGLEKIAELNTTAAKVSMQESTSTAQQLIQAKGPQEFFQLAASQAQPNAEKALAYGRHLVSIASSSQREFSRVTQEQLAASGRKLSTVLEEFSKSGPTGLENVNIFMKSLIGNAAAGYDKFSEATRQATTEAAEANLSAAAEAQALREDEKPPARATRH